MATAANSMMREKISINDDNFFITDGGDTTKHVKFVVSELTDNHTITIPDNNVILGEATSIDANDVDTGGTNDSSFITSTGKCTVGDDNSTLVFDDGDISLQATGTITIDSSASTIDIGTDDVNQNINIGNNGEKIITVGNVSGATGLALNSGTGGISLASTGTGDILINSDERLLLDADGVLELNSSAGQISIGNDAVAQGINIGTGAAARTITVGNTTGTTGLVLTSGTGKTALTSTNTDLDSIKLSTATGGITLASMTSGTGAFGTNIEGTRMFKVNSTGKTAPETYTFTPTALTANVFYVEVRASVEDNATIGNSGAIVLKGSFTMTGAGTITNLGDSTESFGANLAATVTFGTPAGSTFTVIFTPDDTVNTDFIGTISINTGDDGLKLTGIAA